MCGISGYWIRNGDDEGLWRELPLAVRSLSKRGPDGNGVFRDARSVGLGHTRLSIIDLSESGAQPMQSADGNAAIVFNGEIYNYKELRQELTAKGHGFRSESDTEVALAALREWGPGAVHRFIGMFAIAYWDGKKRRMLLLRDRMGVKPLYYRWDGTTLLFGSELKALRSFGGWSPAIDMTALGEFLQFGYIDAPRTIYSGVRHLAPGHFLEIGETGGPVVAPYWSAAGPWEAFTEDEDILAARLEELMLDAFSRRLVADVPVGIFLSGGLDSSVVTALCQKASGRRMHTFTIGFGETKYDESVWAKKVAQHLGTTHTEKILDAATARDIIPLWPEIYDEPFGDSSGIPVLLVSRLAREHVKVALSADGGDELFGGYPGYLDYPRLSRGLGRFPLWSRRLFGATLRATPRRMLAGIGSLAAIRDANKFVDRLIKLSRSLPEASTEKIYEMSYSAWMPDEVDRMLGGYTNPKPPVDDGPGPVEARMMLWDQQHFLTGDILTKSDRATMYAGLEAREPVLDHRLVEFAQRLPLSLRLGSLGSKHLLRKILYRHVPRELVDRPKQGFSIPLLTWLRGDLSPLLDRYLNNGRIRRQGIFDPDMVAAAVKEVKGGSSVNVHRVWYLLVFEMWRDRWL